MNTIKRWYLFIVVTTYFTITYSQGQKCTVVTAYQQDFGGEPYTVTYDTFKTSKQEFIKILSGSPTPKLTSKLLTRNKFDKYVLRSYIYDQWISFLDLSQNGIVEIENKAFVDSGTCLHYIYLKHNQIERIEKEAFAKLFELRQLNLDSNKINFIAPYAFNETNLDVLILSNNNLTNLTNLMFYQLKNLTYLDLSYNHIDVLNGNHFEYLEKLKKLNLSHNNITVLPTCFFTYLLHLIDLKLDSNHIKELPIGVFKNAKQLETLSLSDNQLKSFTLGTFYGLKLLKELNISYNHLTNTHEQKLFTLDNLRVLILDGNNISESINVREIYTHLLKLRTISFADMTWECSQLLNVMRQFALRGIDVREHYLPDNVDKMNIKGIICNDTVVNNTNFETTTKINEHENLSELLVDNDESKTLELEEFKDDNKSLVRLMVTILILNLLILVSVIFQDYLKLLIAGGQKRFSQHRRSLSVELYDS